MTPTEIEQTLFRHMPEDFLRRLVRATFMAYRLSHSECLARYAPTEAINVQPFDRRARIEGYIRDVADAVGLHAEVVRVPDDNWWFHTEVHAGPVVLTANSVSVPCGPVREARFRSTLARLNDLTLWEEPESNDALYVLFLHSRFKSEDPEEQKKYRDLPGSAYLAFPARDLSVYIHELNLFARYQDVVAAELPQAWDQEARLRFLRKSQKALTA